MVAQPQALAKHLPHRFANRVGTLFAGNRLDFGARGSQAGLEGIGGIQQFADGPGATTGGILAQDDHQCGHHTGCDQNPYECVKSHGAAAKMGAAV